LAGQKALPNALIKICIINFVSKRFKLANVLHVPLHDFQKKMSATDLDKNLHKKFIFWLKTKIAIYLITPILSLFF